MGSKDKHTGGCMCGAIRYEALGETTAVLYCHCSSCRRHTGAPVVTFVRFPPEQVTFTEGERKLYASSPDVMRGFCGDCGTPLTWESDWKGTVMIEFHISTLDRPDDYVPTFHSFHNERIVWFDVSDELPRYDAEGKTYRHGPAV